MINWRRGRAADESILRAVENKLGVTLPADYRKTIMTASGGVPDRRSFTAGGQERVFSRLISAEAGRHPNLVDALEWVEGSGRRLVPFATDPFGNMLCFAYVTDQFCTVAFVEAESGEITPLSPSFTAFLYLLSDR